MFHKQAKKQVWVLLLVVLVLTGCEDGEPGPRPIVRIARVESPVAVLPELPERTQLTVRSYTQILPELKSIKRTLEELGGQIDIATSDAYLNCQDYFDLYQDVAELPEFDASGADELTQWASGQYNEAIANILDTSRDLYLTCSAALKGTAKNEPVPFQQWGLSRKGIADSLEILARTIRRLDEELFDATCDIPATLLQAMRCTRKQIERFGGLIDVAVNETGKLRCQPTVDLYDTIVDAPTFDVSGSDEVMQYAYDSYRQAIDIFSDGARDVTGNCRDFLADPQKENTSIPFQQWGLARQKVNDALEILVPAIERLEQQ